MSAVGPTMRWCAGQGRPIRRPPALGGIVESIHLRSAHRAAQRTRIMADAAVPGRGVRRPRGARAGLCRLAGAGRRSALGGWNVCTHYLVTVRQLDSVLLT